MDGRHLELERVQDEVADDVVLPLEQERDARGHEVPDEHLIVVERAGVVGVAGGDRAHGAAAVAHHRLPDEAPRLVLHVIRRAPPLRRRLQHRLGGARNTAVNALPVDIADRLAARAAAGGNLEARIVVLLRSRFVAG